MQGDSTVCNFCVLEVRGCKFVLQYFICLFNIRHMLVFCILYCRCMEYEKNSLLIMVTVKGGNWQDLYVRVCVCVEVSARPYVQRSPSGSISS